MAQDPAIDMLQLDEGTYLKQGGQIRKWSYYSRYVVAANVNTTSIFTAKLGDPLYTTLDATNMVEGGRIPNSQRFDIYGIGVSYIKTATTANIAVTATQASILAWLDSTALEFYITDLTPRFQMTLSQLVGQTLGLVSQPAATQNDNSAARSNLHSLFTLDRMITVTANTTFKVNIYPGVAAAAAMVGDYVKVWLYGDLWSRS